MPAGDIHPIDTFYFIIIDDPYN